jgi:hypothetical protein
MLVTSRVNQSRRLNEMPDSEQQSVAAGTLEQGIFSGLNRDVPTLEFPTLTYPLAGRVNILEKVLRMLRGLRLRQAPPAIHDTREMTGENPYDRTFSGHLMIRL